MSDIHALQYILAVDDKDTAAAMFRALRIQEGFLGGRIQAPEAPQAAWRVQVFFDGSTSADLSDDMLPDGCRRVLIPEVLRGALGL